MIVSPPTPTPSKSASTSNQPQNQNKPQSSTETNNSTPHSHLAPVTTADLKRLLFNSRALISDLSILHGEFASTYSSATTVLILKESDYGDLRGITDFENRVFRLMKKVEKRELGSAVTNSTTSGGGGGGVNGGEEKKKGKEKELKSIYESEHEKLEELYGIYVKMRADIEGLRLRLEDAGKGMFGVHDYEVDIKYQVIGNQTLPLYYKKPKGNKGKGDSRKRKAESSPAPSEASDTPAKKKVKLVSDKEKAKGGGSGLGMGMRDGEKEARSMEMAELRKELERMKKEKAILTIEVNALKAEKQILLS
jgi:hypothetical protein